MKIRLKILFSSVVLSAPPLNAQTTLWDDSFTGTTLDDSWKVHSTGTSSVTQNDALVLLPDGGGFNRAFLVTNNVQSGTDPAVKVEFNGNPVYNFFAHDLQLVYDDLSIPPDVTAGSLIFYSGVSGNPITNNAGPRNGQAGAFVRIRQNVDTLQLGVMDYPGSGGRGTSGTKNLNALPDSIVFNLNAIGWSVYIIGATFTDGSTSTSGIWTNITSATFATDASLVVGNYEEGAATWVSGDPITLGRFQATAFPDNPPTPNPAGFAGLPTAMSSTELRMAAFEGSDPSGVVEYLFTETSGNAGGTSSGWQTSPFYVDSGLTEGLQYSYSVTMRDAVGNVGTASAVASVILSVSEPPAAAAVQTGAWSHPATWGGSVPGAESDVTIPMGVTVTLVGDQECGSVTVMGKLRANPSADCSLHCDWVMVMGAGSTFEVGSNAARYPHQFTLTLKGLPSEANPGGMGSKFLGAMNGGTIDIHGPERVSWTKLSATALGGASITLDDAVDWVAGERIVVTSTDTNWNRAEERTIASVSGDGLTVTLTEPLDYTHTGVTETHTRPSDGKSWSIDLKAEVGLLSRAVTIQGDIYSEYSGFGGHTMAMQQNGMAPSALYVEGAELYRMGQKSILGRYPIHWHLLTDQAQGQYVRNSSIHHSFNRAVTIHGTDYITVEDNFCYDHIGHGIFLENGAERFNTIRGNVVLLTRRPALGEELTPSDNSHDETQNRTPASFWITNPNNIIEDNIAAGTQGTGYWFIFPQTPLEPAASLPYYAGAEPSKEPLGTFDRNTAHSCKSGLDINDQLNSDHSIRTNAAWDNDGPFYLNDCTWFSNNLALYAGFDGRKDNVIHYNHTLANNTLSIMFATDHTVEESMLIADSGHGNLLGASPIMYSVYDGAGQMVDNHMIGWDADHANLFKQPGAATKHPNHRFSGFTWDHAGPPRNVHTRWKYDELPPAGALTTTGGQTMGHNDSNPSVWGQVVYDIDGSVAGLPGSALITNHPFMVTGSETMPANWSRNLVSPNRFAYLRCAYSGTTPIVSVLRTKSGTQTEGFVNFRKHELPLIVNDDFLYTYSYESLPSSQEIQLNFDDTELGDSVMLRFKHLGQLAGLNVTGTAHGSLASLQAASSMGYYVESGGDLYVRAVSTQPYNNLTTISWSGSLNLPMLDADMDGVDDMAELHNGTDPFGFSESANAHFEFTQAADLNGWTSNAVINGLEVSGGMLRGSIIGGDPQLSNSDLNFNGNSVLQIRMRYRNENNGRVDFFWGTSETNGSVSPSRRLAATYSGSGDWQVLVFNLGSELEWLDQVITRLRIDPNGSTGDFEIDYIRGIGSSEADYAVWAAGWYGGYLSDPWSDWDGDGLSNHAERLWAMDPFTSGHASAISQPLDDVNGVFTYTRRDVGLSGVVYSIWVSTDLVEWTEDTSAIQSRLSLENEIETMEVNLDSNWLNHDELFIQVRAVE